MSTTIQNLPERPHHLFTDYAKTAVIKILRTFFSIIPEFQYDTNPKKTLIEIADKYTVNLETVEKQQKIIIGRQRCSWMHKSIDQFRGEGFLGDSGGNFADAMQTSLAVQCISKEGLEAEYIADLVCACFTMFRRIIRQLVPRLIDIRVTDIGPEQPLRADVATEVVGVVVLIDIWHQVNWKITPSQEQEFKNIFLSSVTGIQEVKC